MTTPQTISELYPSKWLRAADLNGRSFVVTILVVSLEELRNPRTHKNELKAVLDFGRSKRMALNPTQCWAIADIAQDEHFSAWPDTRITISPGLAHNGKRTIVISPAPAPQVTAVDEEE